MPSDQQVTSQMILQSMLELQRQGSTPTLRHLEKVEPDLASFIMESQSTLHGHLMAVGAPAKKTQRLLREVEMLVLVSVVSLRRGHLALWEQQMGADLQQLDLTDRPSPEDTDRHATP